MSSPSLRPNLPFIVMNASGCGAQVREYGHMLRNDAAYAAKAQRLSELTKDVAEILPPMVDAIKAKLVPQPSPASAGEGGAQRRGRADGAARVVFHSPCTLQHAQQVRGEVETLLTALGAEVSPVGESHFCCGSAGTYSVLQPDLAYQLRDRRLGHLQAPRPEVILSANVGCITHLQSGTERPVQHWIEWLDARLSAAVSR